MNDFIFELDLREVYVSPKCEIIEINSEGILCSSENVMHDRFEEEDFEW